MGSALFGVPRYGPAVSGSGRREEGGGKGRGQRRELRSSFGPGVLSCGLSTKLPQGLGTQGVGAGVGPRVRDGSAYGSWRGGFTSLRVLPAGLAILGLPVSHLWPCTSRRRWVHVVPDPSNRGGSGESREIPARRTRGAAAASCRRRCHHLPPQDRPLPQPRQPRRVYTGRRRGRAGRPHLRSPQCAPRPACDLARPPRGVPRSSCPGLRPPAPTPALQPASPGWRQPRPRCS